MMVMWQEDGTIEAIWTNLPSYVSVLDWLDIAIYKQKRDVERQIEMQWYMTQRDTIKSKGWASGHVSNLWGNMGWGRENLGGGDVWKLCHAEKGKFSRISGNYEHLFFAWKNSRTWVLTSNGRSWIGKRIYQGEGHNWRFNQGYSWEIICKNIVGSFNIFGLWKPICPYEKLRVWQRIFLELEHLLRRAGVRFNYEMVTNEMELKIFNGSFDNKYLFKCGMVILFYCCECATLVSVGISFSFNFFEKYCSLLLVTNISLKDPMSFS